MEAQHLLNDQRFIFRDFPNETITIDGVDYSCLCTRASDRKDLEIGGFQELPAIEISMERGTLPTLPNPGQRASFRGKQYRVIEIVHDHPQSPIRFMMEDLGK